MFLFLLSKLPFLATAATFVKTRSRLAIEYGLIAVLIAVAGFTFSLWLSKGETEKELSQAKTSLASVQGRLNSVEQINQTQEATIGELKELRLIDAQALTGLLSDYKTLSKSDTRARKRLDTLEKTNEVVRNYLDQRIPPDLACLLNDTCGATGTGDTGREGNRAPSSALGTGSALPSAGGKNPADQSRPH